MFGDSPPKSGLRSIAPSLLSGGLLGLAAPPWGWWPLAWIALIPLWVAVNRTPSPRSAFSKGWIAGSVYYLILLVWLVGMHPLTWLGFSWTASLALAVGCWLLVSLIAGLSFGAWAVALGHLSQTAPLTQISAATLIWVILEYGLTLGPLAFPWGTLAITQSNGWYLPWAELGGGPLLVALILTVNGLLSTAWIQQSWTGVITTGAILLGALSWRGTLPTTGSELPKLKVGIIQINITQEARRTLTTKQIMAMVTQGYQDLVTQGAQIVITSETVLTRTWDETAFSTPLWQAIQRQKTPLLLGAWGETSAGFTNRLYALGANGVIDQVDKVQLVPFGETIPFARFLGNFSPLGNPGLIAGLGKAPLQTPWGAVGVAICYDSAFPYILRTQVQEGATWLVTSTNDAWFGPTMPLQRHALETLRAVELGRPLVRASNTGSSGAIDPRGQTLILTQRNKYDLVTVAITPQQRATLYTTYGNLWILGVLLGAVGIGQKKFPRF